MKKEGLRQLLSQMTLAEKIGQMTQLGSNFFETENQKVTGPIYNEYDISEENITTIGSVLNAFGTENIIKIQENYLKKSRLKIPLLFLNDVVHGMRMIFPISLGLSTSFNPDLARQTAEAAAREATASGIHGTYAPMVDLVRDPRWGRVAESTGEDALLNSLFAEAFVKGFQGTSDLSKDFEHMAACVKHFGAYGAVEAGRDYNIVDMPENKLREIYLPSYKAAVDAGVKLVMTSFNTINGVPATGCEWLMKQVLRNEWGFEGVLITDYGAIMEQISWGTVANEAEAAKQALRASVDIEMMTTSYIHSLYQLIDEGVINVKEIDEAVLRVLELKNDLGLFEDPFRGAGVKREKEQVFTKEDLQLAYDAACESIVLLKNDQGILPLSRNEKVKFDGPLLHSSDLLGAWSLSGHEAESNEEAYFVSEEMTIKEADKVVLFVGEPSSHSGEAESYADIRLSREQVQLINETAENNKNVILVIFAGRPLDLSEVTDKVKAILYCFFPGTMGKKAIDALLYGDVNPSAKLTMSLPRIVGQVPIYYNHYNTGRPTLTGDEDYVSRYQDTANTPLYAFGHGLSYTTFAYSGFSVTYDTDDILVYFELINTGKCKGAEVVQVYVRDLVASTARPLKQLKAFEKVWLMPEEKKAIQLRINKSQLKFYNFKNELVFEPGEFQVFVGSASDAIIYDKIITIKE